MQIATGTSYFLTVPHSKRFQARQSLLKNQAVALPYQHPPAMPRYGSDPKAGHGLNLPVLIGAGILGALSLWGISQLITGKTSKSPAPASKTVQKPLSPRHQAILNQIRRGEIYMIDYYKLSHPALQAHPRIQNGFLFRYLDPEKEPVRLPPQKDPQDDIAFFGRLLAVHKRLIQSQPEQPLFLTITTSDSALAQTIGAHQPDVTVRFVRSVTPLPNPDALLAKLRTGQIQKVQYIELFPDFLEANPHLENGFHLYVRDNPKLEYFLPILDDAKANADTLQAIIDLHQELARQGQQPMFEVTILRNSKPEDGDEPQK